MASYQVYNRKYEELIRTIGRSAMNALYPNDFEVYMMALELAHSIGNTIDYLSFPIMPEQIQKNEPKRTNIKNSASGITVLSSSKYISEEISIKGNFGRNFKILLSPKEPVGEGVAFSTNVGKYNLSQINVGNNAGDLSLSAPKFEVGVKTGYGAIKILQAIISKSNGTDTTGKPFRLYFYNLALGESYLVVVPPNGLTLSQNKDSKNMIWEYSLTLNTVAPLSALKTQNLGSSLLTVIGTNAIQKSVNTFASSLKTML